MAGGLYAEIKYIRIFNKLGAIDADHAVTLDEAGIVNWSIIFESMVKKGVFISCENGKYYVDNSAVKTFMGKRNKTMVITAIVVLVIFIIYIILRLG